MNNFNGGGFKSNGLKFGGKKKNVGGKRHESRPRRERTDDGSKPELFSATCSECRNKCEVPFRPSSDKPVYCSACFGMKKSANETRGSENKSRPDHTKPPREERSPRHDPSRGRSDDGIADLKRQISGLEQKLNRILDLINPPMPSKKVATIATEEVVKKTVKKVAAKKAPAKVAPKKKAAKVTPKKVVAKKVVKKATKVASKKALKK